MIKTKNEIYSICKKIPLILPNNNRKKIDNFINLPDDHFKSVKKKLIETISDDDIIKRLSNVQFLTLELTQDCNLRCRYCSFSGIYKNRRVHNPRKMSLLNIKRAVDLFFEQIESPLRTTRKPPLISFFGGEPLVEFKTLVKIVEYVKILSKRLNININFMITTNGVLLNEHVVKFLVKENFKLDISLDGPESEQDRFRLKRNDNGSYNQIYKNIKYIKSNYPQYYNERVGFKVTLHPEHDLSSIEEFYVSNSDLFHVNNVSIFQILINENLEIITNEKWKELRKIQLEKNENYYKKEKLDSWFYEKFFLGFLINRFDSKGTPLLSDTYLFTGNCFPGGQRIFIDVHGKIQICERGLENFPIGNLEDGFNIKEIKRIVYEWRKNIIKRKCWNCNFWYFCPLCFASNSKSDRFLITTQDCERIIKVIKRRINLYLEIKESKNEIKDISNSSIDDFLNSL